MDELLQFLGSTGLSAIGPGEVLMIVVGIVFIYLAVARDMEPYELLPIGLGVIVANLPLTGLLVSPLDGTGFQESGVFGVIFHYGLSFWNILPPIIFLGLAR